MRQPIYGLILYVFLGIPFMRNLFESYMILHMHMQMMLLLLVGILVYPFIKRVIPKLFSFYNQSGLPLMIIFLALLIFWMLPRTMDEALDLWYYELFKFISIPFMGIVLRDSIPKIKSAMRIIFMLVISIILSVTGLLYMFSDSQLCNSYLIADQISVGIGLIVIAVMLLMYIFLLTFTDQSQYYNNQRT